MVYNNFMIFKENQNIFFTADWHLFHHNIIKFCKRPIKDILKLHQHMIFKHNQLVSKNDIVFVLGDVTLEHPDSLRKVSNVINKFNGRKHLILGNHDEWRVESYLNAGFESVHSHLSFTHEGFDFYLVHDPAAYTMIEFISATSILLCGHIHQLFFHLFPNKRVINVGIDRNNELSPMAMTEILTITNKYRKETIERFKNDCKKFNRTD